MENVALQYHMEALASNQLSVRIRVPLAFMENVVLQY
jgi:hypothetical protein